MYSSLFISNPNIFHGVGEHLVVIVKIMLGGADVLMIGQFLHNADIHAGINQFGNKQMASKVARTLNVEFPVNRSKQTADTGAVIQLPILMVSCVIRMLIHIQPSCKKSGLP
mgnify:CR=1 FL=1